MRHKSHEEGTFSLELETRLHCPPFILALSGGVEVISVWSHDSSHFVGVSLGFKKRNNGNSWTSVMLFSGSCVPFRKWHWRTQGIC